MHEPSWPDDPAIGVRVLAPALVGVLWGYSVHFLLNVVLHWYYVPRAPLSHAQLGTYGQLLLMTAVVSFVVGIVVTRKTATRARASSVAAIVVGMLVAAMILVPYAEAFSHLYQFDPDGL